MTINDLHDELLLEVFDSYRQITDQLEYGCPLWKEDYGWFNLAHVCTRWRAVVFASSFHLDINIIIKPEYPSDIKTILSGHLPIAIDYWGRPNSDSASALWRKHTALSHRDRVREIAVEVPSFVLGEFIRATNHHFPALEKLVIVFPEDHKLEIPTTFLRGPDQSSLPLRHVRLYRAPLASASVLLLSATTLTDLTLLINSNPAVFDPSQGSLLLSCLQGMQSLRRLDLITPDIPQDSQSQHSTPKDIVPLLKLTRFHYCGRTIFLENLMSGLSAPSLKAACFSMLCRNPLLCLSRVIDDVREEFRSIRVTFNGKYFGISASTQSGKINDFQPPFRLSIDSVPHSIKSINGTASTKLAMAEELTLSLPSASITTWEHVFSLRKFLRQFRSVRVLRVVPFEREVGLYLQQNEGEAILPVLEEIELSVVRLKSHSDEEHQRRVAQALAAFEPLVSARERAGRLVKVFICED